MLLLFIACDQKEETAIDYVLFSGSIENPSSEVVKVIGDDLKIDIALNEDNTFSDTLRIAASTYFTVVAGRESSTMYLNQGDVINMTLNTEEFDESISYTGLGSEKNNYLAKKYMNSEQNAPGFEDFFGLIEDDFTNINSKIFKEEVDFLMASAIKDENFIESEKKALKYSFLSNISNYKEYYEYVSKESDITVSEEFYSKLNGFNYTNESDYKAYDSYRTIVANHYLSDYDDEEGLRSTFAEINKIESEYIKNQLLNSFRYGFSPNRADLDVFYSLLMETSTDAEYKEKITEKYEKIRVLTPGNESPEFAYPDRNGDVISLDDLKGNYVYVDVWATWCGPCKREIPYLKELTKEYEGKDIKFVSISIDEVKDKNKWLAMMDEKEMEGVQLFADKDWSSDFVTAYAIEGIPRFILIDKEGNIVSADVERPSNPKLKEKFDQLL